MRTQANILHSALRILLWLFWTVGSYLWLSSTEQFNPFRLRAITRKRPDSADTRITNRVGRCWLGLFCSELWQSAFSSMAVRIKLYRSRHHRNCIQIGVWWFTGRPRHFFSEWQLHRCYWHKVHKADWQSKLSTYCASSPQIYRESKWLWMAMGSIPDGVTGIFSWT